MMMTGGRMRHSLLVGNLLEGSAPASTANNGSWRPSSASAWGLVPFDTLTSLLMSTRAQFEKKNDFRVLDF
jgi:hypothetical protein